MNWISVKERFKGLCLAAVRRYGAARSACVRARHYTIKITLRLKIFGTQPRRVILLFTRRNPTCEDLLETL